MGKTLGYGEITVANVTEPFTVMLTNEAQQFATDSNRKVTSAQSYYTDIIVIRGSQERTDYTIGNITSGSGITVSKNSKRVTFSVSAGTTIGADAGVIEIPITLDGQTVKKQFSWSCGKQGPQGVQGKDGTSIKITSKSVTYQTSTSGTTTPTGTWSTTVPMVNNGQYLWTKTTVQYSDGNKTEAYSVSYKGTNGTNGTSVTVSKTEVTYQVSTSGTTAPTGTWSTTMPSCDQGQYLWTKTYVKYSDGKETTSYSVSYKGVDGEKFAFNMLRETNQGSKHWVNMGASGKYSVESITTEDSINAVKLICTEPIASNEWQFCDFSDYEMLKSLKASTTYTLSYDIKANRSGKILHNIKTGGGQKVFFANDIACKVLGNETWEHVSLKMTSGTTLPNLDGQVIYMFGDALSKVGYSIIKNLKLTEGIVDTPWAPHPEDLEGRGVSETVQYYLVTSQASGVTSSTSGWSTDITTQKLTADKKYLWNCYQTKYSDGTSEPISTPKVIGVYGDKGQKGEDGQDGAGFHWNLLKYSGDLSQMSYGKVGGYIDTQEFVSDASTPSKNALKSTITTVGNGMYIQGKYLKKEAIKRGNIYTVSVWCKCSSAKDIGVMNVEFLDKKVNISMPKLSTEWQQYIITGVANKDVTTTSSGSAISFYYGNKMAVGDIFYISSPKVEEGDKPSPWCTTYEETLAKSLSITPSSQYFKSTDGGKTFAPNTITIKPTIQGEISFGKWQYSIDGGVSFADVVSGQKGLTISNNVLTVSKDSSLYSDAVTMITFRAVANDISFYDTCSIAKIYDVSDIEIGGRNLLLNSDKEYVMGFGIPNTTWTDGYAYIGLPTTRINDEILPQNNAFLLHPEAGKTYTQTIWIETDADVIDLNAAQVSWFTGKYGHVLVAAKIIKLADNSYKLTSTHTVTKEDSDIRLFDIMFLFSALDISNSGTYLKFGKLKVEQGNVSTDWTPATEDVQTAILSTKSEISDVSLKVDNNKQAIEQRVEKTTYQQDLKLVKGDISKANEGLNKWRYEIYPKSLFASEYQGKSTMDVFAKNTNLTPSQSVLINDMDLSIAWNYDNNYIGYALTFAKFSAAKSVAITFAHDDGAHIYLNGKLIGGSDAYSQTGESLTLGFVKGWNCIEVIVNEGASTEGFKLGTTISAISECQLMNCYYGTPVARQSHITNQLVENTTNIKGISTKVSKVTSVIGENGENFTSFKNDYSDFKQTMNGFKTTVGQTYVTKDDFNGLEIGGRNLLLYSQTIRAHKDYYGVGWLTDEVETFNGCPVWSVKNQWGRLTWLFKSHVIDRGLVKVGDTLTYSLYAKTNNASGKSINCSYRFKGNTNAYWFNGSAFNVGTNWTRYSVTFTITKDMLATDTYMTEIGFEETASMSGDDKVYYACPKLERGTKATDYTPALEDNEINGQNLISNLPVNWEQGGINGGQAVGSTYASIKSSTTYRIRIKDIFSVSGNITVSAGGTTTNSSKETLSFYGTLYDAKKGLLRETGWKSFPSTINCGDAKYMSIILRWGDGTKTQIAPSDISQICLKIERGTSATPFTLAPEDVNGKIVNVETIANQTANKFEWIVKSGTSSSNFEITDRLMNLVSANINLDGIVSFMNTAKGDGRKNLYNLDYSSFENVASQEDAICYAKDNGVTSVGIDSSVSYDGDKSLKISYTTANLNSSTTPLYLGSSANNYGCVKIQAGKQYILSCYVKSDSTTGLFMIDIQGHDTPDTKTDGLYLSNIDPRKLPGSSTGVNLSTDWQRAVCAIKVADNATGLYWSVVPLIWGRPSSSSAPQTFNVWVDCIMLEEVDSISNEPGTYIFDKETIIDGGSIKTDTITGNQILAGSITADKIATDAIKSHNYISSGGTQGSFLNLGDGSFTSPNLSWDSNGNLIAKNANLSGEITATNGSIAGWTIISNKMYTTGSGKYTGIGKYGSAYAFWAGATSNDNGNSAVFKVGHTGKLTATDADITGTITATNGKIGRYDITSTYLMTNSGSNASGIGGNQAFWAGAEDSNSAPFRVGYDGVLWAENAAIRGSIETGNLGDEGDTVSIINGHIGIQGTSNNVEIYSTGFKFGIDGDYYLMSVSEGVKCYRNLYATDFVADGWLYCSEVHSSGAVVIGADSESFYWAHGYQIARGTSWGGVCVGDDSQQLRLYGSSIWASHSISTSDENLKENFTTLDQYENFYMNLNPIGFNYIGDYDGKKTHFGFGAHKTENVLESEGYDADKFAVVTHRPLVQEDIEKRFGKDVEVDIETEYGVSYTEFIALNTHMIQKTRRELTKVKQEKADLEVRLQAIEAKLGL